MNASEKQLADFLAFKHKHYPVIHLLLRPQGDNTIIEKQAVNLCEVEIYGNTYRFGGISEKVYDNMVKKYDYREKLNLAD